MEKKIKSIYKIIIGIVATGTVATAGAVVENKIINNSETEEEDNMSNNQISNVVEENIEENIVENEIETEEDEKAEDVNDTVEDKPSNSSTTNNSITQTNDSEAGGVHVMTEEELEIYNKEMEVEKEKAEKIWQDSWLSEEEKAELDRKINGTQNTTNTTTEGN